MVTENSLIFRIVQYMRRVLNHFAIGLASGALLALYLVFEGLPGYKTTGPLLFFTLLSIWFVWMGFILLKEEIEERRHPQKTRLLARSQRAPASPQARTFQRKSARSEFGIIASGDFEIAGPRQILARRLGLAITVGYPDANGGGVIPVKCYRHPGFIGLETFPSIAEPEYMASENWTLCMLRPIDDGRTSIKYVSPDLPVPAKHADLPPLPQSEAMIAEVVRLIPGLEYWEHRGMPGKPTEIRFHRRGAVTI